MGRHNLGSNYVLIDLPDDCEPDTLGLDALEQYCKLTHYRTHKVTGKRIQSMMVLGTKAEVESALAQPSFNGMSHLEQEQAKKIAQLEAQLRRAQGNQAEQPKANSGQASDKELTDGVVQHWNFDRGYGFIRVDDGSDYFCHSKSITDGNELVEGASVQFEAGLDPQTQKQIAKKVKGGRLVLKSKFGLPGGRLKASPALRAFDRLMTDSKAEIRTKDQAIQFIGAMHERKFSFIFPL